MAPRRRKKPIEVPNTQTIDFSATGDTIECEIPIDPQLLDTQASQPPTHSLPTTPSQPSEELLDRIEWTAEMIQVLFSELLEQAQDGK